jgi:hypothetical protein
MTPGSTSGIICGHYVRASNVENKIPPAFNLPADVLLEGNYGVTVGVPASAGRSDNIGVSVDVYLEIIVGMTVGV